MRTAGFQGVSRCGAAGDGFNLAEIGAARDDHDQSLSQGGPYPARETDISVWCPAGDSTLARNGNNRRGFDRRNRLRPSRPGRNAMDMGWPRRRGSGKLGRCSGRKCEGSVP